MLKDNSSLGEDAQHPARGIGHYDYLLSRRESALRNASPAVAARINGERPSYHNAKTHRITVNIPTGHIFVERVEEVAPTPPEAKSLPPPVVAPEPVTVELPVIAGDPLPLNARNIIRVAAELWERTPAEITGPCRAYPISRPRIACYRIMRDHLGLSHPAIGLLLGKRDHTSVISGYRRSFYLHVEVPDWRDRYERALAAFGLTGCAPVQLKHRQPVMSKLSVKDVERICATRKPQKVWASEYGVSQSLISRILGGRRWRKVASRAEPNARGGGGDGPIQHGSSPAAARLDEVKT